MFDGRLQVYRRDKGRTWQCAARVGGERFRESTGEEDLDRAKDVAEEWYLRLRGMVRNGEIKPKERSFGEAADHYMRQARVLAATVRSPKYIELLDLRMKRHIVPFFGTTPLPEVNRGLVQTYRVARAEETIARTGKPPSRSTMNQEIVHIRQVLKHAEGLGWLSHLPNLTMPYMTQGKRERRAWFSPEEYKQLYTATRRRAESSDGRRGWKKRYQDLHDYVLFVGNSGLRPDESARLEIRDICIEDDFATGQTILVIDVRGKTGVGYCKTMPGAVFPYKRLVERRAEELRQAGMTNEEITKQLPYIRLFPKFGRDAFNNILREEGLKRDRDGRVRTAYSLRHTYISMRLMEGANIYQIANNCRTSVQMIEEFYAAHIKDRIDTTAINLQRPKAQRKVAKGRPVPPMSAMEQDAAAPI
ncbi:integrase [Caulobacter mirabilis]|uniref:Integrase n=2 Tax=Caulobacter mirabilis TaxID=69666 RepID=A0A2D2AYN9_9CAUL|nr:integrase [Caulobacter mirabilis]